MELSYEVDAPAEVVGARSVELASEAGDVDVLREVLLVSALSLWGPGSAPERLGLIEELLDLAPEGELRALVLFRLGGRLFDCGRPEESDEAMRECTAAAADPTAHRSGDPAGVVGSGPSPRPRGPRQRAS